MSIDQVQNIEPLRAYTALAAQTVFAYPFPIFDESDLKVYVDNVLQVISTDYTVDGVGEDTGGNVTFLSAMAGGEVVVIYRETAIERLTDMQQNGPWRSTTTNDEFDKLTVIAQELRRDVRRAIRLPLEADVDSEDIELRPLSNWLERYVFIGADGTPEPAIGVDVVTLSQSLIGQTLYPQTAAESSAGVTPVNYYYEPGDVRRYGAVGDGSADDTSVIQAAIDAAEAGNRTVYFPAGTYKITSTLTIADGTPISMFGDGYRSVIRKGANGDMISLGLKSELSYLRLDGDGANFTGRGIIIATGSGGDGWQSIHDCTILDTASYNIEYTAAGSGWMSRIVNNRLGVYNRTTFCVKYHDADTNGPRLLANNATLSPLADLAGSLGVNVIGNMGGENSGQTIPTIQMNDDCSRAVIVGNSFECATSITIKGDQNLVNANIMREGYTVASGTTNCVIQGNHGDAVTKFDTDNSGGQSNEIWGLFHTYTPTWTGSGSNPAIGDGTIVARYQRMGRQVHLQIDITMGSTTTYGTGTWTLSLPTTMPAPGNGTSYGTCRMLDSGTIIRTGVCLVSSSGVTAEADSGTGSIGTTVPFTWASGDRLSIDVVYNL